MEELFLLIQKTYGVTGLILATPMGAVYYLWHENKSLHTQLLANSLAYGKDLAAASTAYGKELATVSAACSKELTIANDKVVAAQQQRVSDAQKIAEKLLDVVSEQNGLNKETNMTLDRIGDMFNSLPQRNTIAPEGKKRQP